MLNVADEEKEMNCNLKVFNTVLRLPLREALYTAHGQHGDGL